jgi:phage-related protein
MPDFNYVPLINAGANKQPRVKTAQFGDGYQQRVADGINTLEQTWNLTFRNTAAVINAIDAFLIARNGAASFTWVPPDQPEIKVLCRSWNKTIINKRVYELTASFEQVFE